MPVSHSDTDSYFSLKSGIIIDGLEGPPLLGPGDVTPFLVRALVSCSELWLVVSYSVGVTISSDEWRLRVLWKFSM
jgi:hypothetical protein